MAKENKKDENKADQYPTRWGDTPLRDMFDRFLDDRTWMEPLDFFRPPRMLGRFDRSFFPRVDMSETSTEVKVVADVPGVDPDNIEIDVRDNRMRLSGKTERERESKDDEKPYRYERTYGSFQREFSLPAKVKEDQIKAFCKDGVLTVTLPKLEEEKRKKINIEKQ